MKTKERLGQEKIRCRTQLGDLTTPRDRWGGPEAGKSSNGNEKAYGNVPWGRIHDTSK